jgi:hypothetical protein
MSDEVGRDREWVLPTPSHVDRRLDVTWRLAERVVSPGDHTRATVTVRNLGGESLDVSYSKVAGGVTRPGVDGYLGVFGEFVPGVVRRVHIAPGDSIEFEALVGTRALRGEHLEDGEYVAVVAVALGVGTSRTKATYVLRAPLVVKSATESLRGAFA